MLLLATQQFKFSSQENPKYLDSFTGGEVHQKTWFMVPQNVLDAEHRNTQQNLTKFIRLRVKY